jgi:hypothetical protein
LWVRSFVHLPNPQTTRVRLFVHLQALQTWQICKREWSVLNKCTFVII